jgi:class 3 adenylate cyclase
MFNEFKRVNPYEQNSARTKPPLEKIALSPQERLEFLVRCAPKKHDLLTAETSLFESDNSIVNDIKLIQIDPYQSWTRWPLYLRGISLGILVALLCTTALSALVDQTAQSSLLAVWILIVTCAWAFSADNFEFFYTGKNSEELLNYSQPAIQTLLASANIVFIFFSYFNLGGGREFFNTGFSGRFKKPIIWATAFCVAEAALVLWPHTLLNFNLDLGIIEFYRIFFNGLFGDSGAMWFRSISSSVYLVCAFLLRLCILYVAVEKFRKGNKSALFIILALIILAFAQQEIIISVAGFFINEASLIRLVNSNDSNPWLFLPLIVQALIMFYAASRRNKEIQISLDNMTKSRQRFIEDQNTLLENRVIERTQELQMQTEKTEKLMLNILPQSIAERLKDGDKEVSDKYQNTTILFSDLVGFTKMSSEKTPEELVFLLNDLFKRFDIRALSLGLEKIKTIGDAYMVVGGLPTVDDTHAIRVTKMALGMYEDLAEFNAQHGVRFDMRIGINSGPVVAGVIGHSKFSYDLWGNAVNTASRMESTSVPGKIQVSPSTFGQIKDHFDVQEHQLVECKGLGQIMTYFINGQLQGGGSAFAH